MARLTAARLRPAPEGAGYVASRQGQAIGEATPVSVADVARAAWSNVETGALELSVGVDSVVRADRERLCQLLENLFRNSVEHGHPDSGGGDVVHVNVGSRDGAEGFYVEDTGPGIPPDEEDRVLEYGYSTASEWTGLGLAIVSTIAEAHGWSVRVTEGAEGGAQFEVVTSH